MVALRGRLTKYISLGILFPSSVVAGLFFFFFFFFFFVIMRSLFLRYKKPHAALAMEKTKPINQKQITKESHSTS